MAQTYSTNAAARASGVPAATIRLLLGSDRYGAPYTGLWESAAPPPGLPRALSVDDVRRLAYIHQRRSEGVPHETIAAQLRAGALDTFDWQPPPPEETTRRASTPPPPEEPPAQSAALVLQSVAAELGRVMGQQIADAQARADALAEELRAAESARAAAEARADMLERELTRSRRPWWARLLGR